MWTRLRNKTSKEIKLLGSEVTVPMLLRFCLLEFLPGSRSKYQRKKKSHASNRREKKDLTWNTREYSILLNMVCPQELNLLRFYQRLTQDHPCMCSILRHILSQTPPAPCHSSTLGWGLQQLRRVQVHWGREQGRELDQTQDSTWMGQGKPLLTLVEVTHWERSGALTGSRTNTVHTQPMLNTHSAPLAPTLLQ